MKFRVNGYVVSTRFLDILRGTWEIITGLDGEALIFALMMFYLSLGWAIPIILYAARLPLVTETGIAYIATWLLFLLITSNIIEFEKVQNSRRRRLIG